MQINLELSLIMQLRGGRKTELLLRTKLKANSVTSSYNVFGGHVITVFLLLPIPEKNSPPQKKIRLVLPIETIHFNKSSFRKTSSRLEIFLFELLDKALWISNGQHTTWPLRQFWISGTFQLYRPNDGSNSTLQRRRRQMKSFYETVC